MTTTTTATSAASAATSVRNTEREPKMLKKRVGSTDYIIAVRYSQSGKEDLQDKILRLIEGEVVKAYA